MIAMSATRPLTRSNFQPPATNAEPAVDRLSGTSRQWKTRVTELASRFPQLIEALDQLHSMLSTHRKTTYTVDEIAQLTGRSCYTIRRWITEGRLNAIRIAEGGPRGRLLIPRSELDRLINAGRGTQIPDTAVERANDVLENETRHTSTQQRNQ